ncbi:hypothetical protein GGI08_008091, partial [Coemansia sp. S2]
MPQRHSSSPGAARAPPPTQMSIRSSPASLPGVTRIRRPTSVGLPTTATLAVCNVAVSGAFSPVVESVGLGKGQPLSSRSATKSKTNKAGSSSNNQGCARHSATNSDCASDAAARCSCCPASLMLPGESDNTSDALDNRRCMQQCLSKTTMMKAAVVIPRPQSSMPESPEPPHTMLQALDNPDSNNNRGGIKSVARPPPAHVASAVADDSLPSSTSDMPSQTRSSCSTSPSSSSSSASTEPVSWDHYDVGYTRRLSRRTPLRPNSIFYRPRRRGITPPPSAAAYADADADDNNDPHPSLNDDADANADSAYEPEPTTVGNVDEECDNEAFELLRQWEMEEDRLAEIRRHEVAASNLAWSLPFGRCVVVPDTQELMYSHALSPALRPTVIPAQRVGFAKPKCGFYWPTAEIINTTIEYLELIRTGDVPIVNITIDRRLSRVHDFIWNLIDNTGVEMGVAIACVILLQRYCTPKNSIQNAPYGSRHELYLGILMVATTHTHLSPQLDVYSDENILSIIGSPFTKKDLVRLRRETLVALDHRAWISLEDIKHYCATNLFDVGRANTSFEHYKTREKMRSILREREMREKEERRLL